MKASLPLLLLMLLFLSPTTTSAQQIQPEKGYSPHIGVVVQMLDDLKGRVTRSVVNLDQEGTDFLLDEGANRIGAMILHLAATEKYYQLYTFEGRGFNRAEQKEWGAAMDLGKRGREALQDKPISYYLDRWTEVRKETLRLLKTQDDDWFAAKVKGSSMNNHWAWYHVMEHQANHMGQIRLIIGRLP